jgi:hypothetical protein
MSKDNAQSIMGKVFDGDSNPVTARLLGWGPEDVNGEDCVIVEPTDFFSTAPDPNYEGQERPTLAADDLRIAVPTAFFHPPSTTERPDAEEGRPRSDMARCDDCGGTFPVGDLDEIEDRSERMDEGGAEPSGQCPHCGALAYAVEYMPPTRDLSDTEALGALAAWVNARAEVSGADLTSYIGEMLERTGRKVFDAGID